jgi:acetylornithine deacetylase/succinyl-diaminopimelate desuccinylase-like protein
LETVTSTETRRPLRDDTKKSALLFNIIVAIIIGAIAISLLQLQSPKAVSSDSATTEFSAERAFSHLKEFAVSPHPLGSKEHDRVRDYLVQELETLGLAPEIQKVNSLNLPRTWVAGGMVENIVAKIDGTNSSKAIMLVAHYDSVTGGPGVADDGAGVAAILETVRALKETKPLKNDIIILLTDGEENGLLGAKAFVEEHPWVRDVGLVLNFEARGNEGPAFMFETSDNN